MLNIAKSSSFVNHEARFEIISISLIIITCTCVFPKSSSPLSKTVLTNNCRCPYKRISTQSGIKFTTKPINEIRKRSLNIPEILGQTNANEITENYLTPQETKSKTINILFLKSGKENKHFSTLLPCLNFYELLYLTNSK